MKQFLAQSPPRSQRGFQFSAILSVLCVRSAKCCTANEAAAATLLMPGLTVSANAVTTAREIPANGWFVISTYGDHPSPDRTYTQVFDRAQAEETVKTWNSISARVARITKNIWHRIEAKFSAPIFEGHIDTDPQNHSKLNPLGEMTELRATENGLEAFVKWNSANMATRGSGPLYPSALWWHEPPNEQRKVFPVHLESVALVPTPNITSVPAWTKNQQQNQNPMNEEQLKALRVALGLGDGVSVEKAIETAQSAYQLSISNATALTTANSDKTKLEKQVADANAAINTVASERDAQKTLNTQLSTLNSELIDGTLNLLEGAGKITAAQREETKAKFTANDAKPVEVIKTLTEKKGVLNLKEVEINNKRIDISTANARFVQVQTAVQKRMKEDDCDYTTAFGRVQADPQYKQLFEAMEDPTKKKAA